MLQSRLWLRPKSFKGLARVGVSASKMAYSYGWWEKTPVTHSLMELCIGQLGCPQDIAQRE